jgi:hypothetical protein
MPGFGGYNSFPFKFGGGTATHEYEHMNMLTALRAVLDTSEGTEHWCESYAEALAIAMIWAISGRVRNQMIPMKMMENLPVWENVRGLVPKPDDTLVSRRRKLSAKTSASVGNSPPYIESVCSTIAGSSFDNIEYSDESNHITYWAGVNPGPPGYEWASTRPRIGVVLNTGSLSDDAFYDMRQEIATQLNDIVQAPGEFTIGTQGPLTAGLGIVGRTFL